MRVVYAGLAILMLYGAVQSQGKNQTENARGLQALFAAVASVASPVATPAAPDIDAIGPVEHNLLHRPIELSDDLVHWVDRSYPYGATQQGARAVHLGVEFVNPRHTPIYAAKSGSVVFASVDDEVLIGPQLDYYGNVVILAHQLNSLAARQVFTLYGHLESINVEVGQSVDDLTLLGTIGSSGVALGPHLHFEVRVDDPYDYRMTRNPELWLQHYVGRGMIIGRIRDQQGEPVLGKRISIRSDTVRRDVYSYEGETVNSDPVWDEDFALGDLPSGEYQVAVLNDEGNIAFLDNVVVEAYRTTFVDIALADS